MIETSLLEQFILNPEERKNVISKFTKDSEEYFILSICDVLSSDIPENEKKSKLAEIKSLNSKRPYPFEKIERIFLAFELNNKPLSNSNEIIKKVQDLYQPTLNHSRTDTGSATQSTTSFSSSLNIDVNSLLNSNAAHLDISNPQVQYFAFEKNMKSVISKILTSGRVVSPDHPNLVKIIVDYFTTVKKTDIPNTILQCLTIQQLDEIRKLMPQMINNVHFVNQYLMRLVPNPGDDVENDYKAREEHLNALLKFASKLSVAFINIKVNILYSLIKSKLDRGVLDEDLFVKYIEIPKYDEVTKMTDEKVQRYNFSGNAVLHHKSVTVPDRNTSNELVKRFLIQYFKDKKSYSFTSFLKKDIIEKCFALSKLYYGKESEHDAALKHLSTSEAAQIRDSVSIEFDSNNKKFFYPEDTISLTLEIKNIKKLYVKIFEINTNRYYRDNKKEIEADITLDGLVPNKEEVYTYDCSPYTKTKQTFEFPYLKNRGVYAIEFIGGEKGLRALVRKGKLSFIERPSANGHKFTIVDEYQNKYTKASIWMDGHRYHVNDEGDIIVPYTSRPGTQSILIINDEDNFTVLEKFNHLKEDYQFDTSFYVDREQLLSLKKATVLVNSNLYLHSIPISVEHLENVTLTISTVNLDNVSSQKEVKNISLKDNMDYTYTFHTPDRINEISFTLTAELKKLTGERITVSGTQRFELNKIDQQLEYKNLLLKKTSDGYFICVLGKSGEPIPNEVVSVSLTHPAINKKINQTLQTDNTGKIKLGNLDGIESITFNNMTKSLIENQRSPILRIHGTSTESLTIPFDLSTLERRNVSLFSIELFKQVLLVDYFDHLSLNDGYLQIKPLPPGDYKLYLKHTNSVVDIKIVKGVEHSGWIFGEKTVLERGKSERLQAKVETLEDKIQCTIKNYSDNVKVHIIASDFKPDFELSSVGANLKYFNPAIGSLGRPTTTYMTRTLGDEYKYVLDRKHLESIPGNTLTRPSLLLNPKALESTKTTHHTLNQGYDSVAPSKKEASHIQRDGNVGRYSKSTFISHCNLDFKLNTSYCFYNLTPNEDGIISIPLEDIGESPLIRILIIDELDYLYKEHSLKDNKISRRATYLTEKRLLDINKHFTEQKSIAELNSGQSFVIQDVSASEYEIYDTFSSVFNFYLTNTNNSTLKEFSWIQNWTLMSEEEKAEKYHKYGCHELHVLLYFKDRPYFDRVIKPYLQNKLQKTLIDDFLVGNDLSKYLEVHRYETLNVFEKILLAERMEKERDSILSSIADHSDYLPDRDNEFNKLFEAGLKGSDLDEEQYERNKEKDMMMDEIIEEIDLEPAPAPQLEMLQSFARQMAPPPPSSGPLHMLSSVPPPQPQKMSYGSAPRQRAVVKKKMLEKRKPQLESQPLYKEIETTKVYAETNYYGRNNKESTKNLVPMNKFWGDYARCKNKDDFVSKNFIFATSSFAEMMFALSVMNLAFGKSKKQACNVEFEDVTMTVQTGSTSALIFYKEIKESEVKQLPVMVSQMFFDPNNRYTHVNGVQMEKYIDGEFLYGKIYGCDYVITNMSSCQQKAEVLLQIPLGAVPVNHGFYTKSFFINLSPFSTQRNSFYFYFPKPGKFHQFPAHLGNDSYVIGYAQPSTFNVVEKLTKHDTQSWEYISQVAEDEELFDYLEKKNIFTVDLTKIAWRLRNKQVYKIVLSILQKRHVYNSTLWAYSFIHQDLDNILVYMSAHPSTSSLFEPYTKLGNVVLDPVEYKLIEHLEYWPIVNARAHQLGNKARIMNKQFSDHYQNFLNMLVKKAEFTINDYLELTYYLLLQDRYKDAKKVFDKIKNLKSPTESSEYILFRDYIECYLDFFNDTPNLARKISEKYIDYPVQRWNKLFATVRQQLDEIEHGSKDLVDVENRDESQSYLAHKSESLEFEVKNDQIIIHHQNIDKVNISYYKMDIELLFSTSPFVQNNLGFFAYIKPNTTETVDLNSDTHETVISVPKEFKNLNIMIEISSPTLNIVKPHFSHSLFVSVVEKYGQLRVCDKETGKPIPKTYIKVYARHNNGSVKFYKDGYTDLRGGFDYTSLNTPDLDTTERFSILIMSPNNGTRIVEASKPKR